MVQMAYQNTSVDEMSQWKPVEHLGKTFRHLIVILAPHLILKSVHLIHVLRLVVSC